MPWSAGVVVVMLLLLVMLLQFFISGVCIDLLLFLLHDIVFLTNRVHKPRSTAGTQ